MAAVVAAAAVVVLAAIQNADTSYRHTTRITFMQEIFPCPCHRTVLQSEVTVRLPTDMHNLNTVSGLSTLAPDIIHHHSGITGGVTRDNQFVSAEVSSPSTVLIINVPPPV